MWNIRASLEFEEQLKKLDSQVAERIKEDVKAFFFEDAPDWESVKRKSHAVTSPRAKKLGLRSIWAARDWRVFFRIQGGNVLVERVFHRETGYEELERYLRSLRV